MSPPEPSPPSDRIRPRRGGDPSERERRALRWGVGVSLLVHVVLVALYPSFAARLSPDERTPPDEPDPEIPAMEVVLLPELAAPPVLPEEVPEALPEEEPEDDPQEPVEEPADPPGPPAVAPPAVAPPPAEVGEPDEEERRTIVERLLADPVDPRLRPSAEAYTEMTDEERAQALLSGMLRSWNDSMAVAAALSEAARDWTYTDDEGRRWGLSPGRLHLGDFSVPLPFSFGTPMGPGDHVRAWMQDDLRRGAIQTGIRETWAERAQEIRRRMEEERNRGGGGGDGP